MTKPEIAAQGQLDAYNNRNIDDFMVWYSDEVKAYDIDNDVLLFEGLEAMRERYSKVFGNVYLHCHLKNRMVLGSTVIDHEEITRDESGKIYGAIAIYSVDDTGLIKTIRFSRGNL